MDYYSQTRQVVYKKLHTDPDSGLSREESVKRQEIYGKNELAKKKPKTMLQRFLAQFKDVMILILLVAAAISFVIACMEGDVHGFFEPVLILIIVIKWSLIVLHRFRLTEKRF